MTAAPSGELPCVRVVELITEYLDGALPDADRARIEAHLDDCDGCTVVLDQFRTTIEVTGTLGADDVDAIDEPTRSELLGAFRRWAAER